jgi:hypothetical protein
VWESCYSSTQRRRVMSFETAPIHAADDMLYLIAIAIAMAIDHRLSNLNSQGRGGHFLRGRCRRKLRGGEPIRCNDRVQMLSSRSWLHAPNGSQQGTPQILQTQTVRVCALDRGLGKGTLPCLRFLDSVILRFCHTPTSMRSGRPSSHVSV